MKKIWSKFIETTFWKTFKEESKFVPLVLIVFLFVNWALQALFPSSAFFDPASQFETILYNLLTIAVIMWSTHLFYRVSFPNQYRVFIDRFYHRFNEIAESQQVIYSAILFVVILLVVTVTFKGRGVERPEVRTKMKALLDSQLSIRETTENSGPEVDLFLKNVGLKPGFEWCGAYASWNLDYFHIPNPHSAWSPNFAQPKDIIWRANRKGNIEPLCGDCFTLYYPALRRVGHVGFFYEKDKEGWDINQAGNTSGNGSRRGDRVGRKKMDRSKIYAYSRYIK